MVHIITSDYSRLYLETRKNLNEVIASFISEEEVEKFLVFEPIDTRNHITPGDNKRIQLVGTKARDIFEEITYSHPEIIEQALKIRDAHGQLLFVQAFNLIEFIALPQSQWLQTVRNGRLGVKVDIKKIKPDLLEDLIGLKRLALEISSENFLNHVIALRALKVPFKNLANLDCNRHPQEVAFYYHNPRLFTYERTAVIFSCNPEIDWNSSFNIRGNEFYATLYKVFNLSYKIITEAQCVNQELEKLNEEGADVALIIFQGHASKDIIEMTETMEFDENNLSECLTSLQNPDRVVVLLHACSTGLGIAQKVANRAKLTVWAPNADCSGIKIKFENDTFVFDSDSPYYNFVKFTPQSGIVQSDRVIES